MKTRRSNFGLAALVSFAVWALIILGVVLAVTR